MPLHFNPRAPCGARRTYTSSESTPADFNPRAPCGARRRTLPPSTAYILFQSTCPLRGTTRTRVLLRGGRTISIHVPLAGHDTYGITCKRSAWMYFNPRAPCGARRASIACPSTRVSISIHVPLAGHDRADTIPRGAGRHFNPRAPCGARR